MLFTTYGDKHKRAVLLMHGMCQDWRSMYQFLHKLEDDYYLIIPAMDVFYENSGEFTSFSDQCRQIEEYIIKNHNGKLYGIYGISQGTIILSELLARNRLEIKKAFFDGTYVAHQGVEMRKDYSLYRGNSGLSKETQLPVDRFQAAVWWRATAK